MIYLATTLLVLTNAPSITPQVKAVGPSYENVKVAIRDKVSKIFSDLDILVVESGEYFQHVMDFENNSAHKVYESGKETLPHWLTYNKKKNKLMGIPTNRDIQTGLKIEFHRVHENGLTADSLETKYIFIDIIPSKRQFLCGKEPATVASIIYHHDLQELGGHQRIKLLRKMVNNIDYGIHDFVLEEGNRMEGQDLLTSFVRMAGPGDPVKGEKSSFTVSWRLKCAFDIAGDKTVSKLREYSANESFASLSNVPVLGWFVYTMKRNHRFRRTVNVVTSSFENASSTESDATTFYGQSVGVSTKPTILSQPPNSLNIVLESATKSFHDGIESTSFSIPGDVSPIGVINIPSSRSIPSSNSKLISKILTSFISSQDMPTKILQYDYRTSFSTTVASVHSAATKVLITSIPYLASSSSPHITTRSGKSVHTNSINKPQASAIKTAGSKKYFPETLVPSQSLIDSMIHPTSSPATRTVALARLTPVTSGVTMINTKFNEISTTLTTITSSRSTATSSFSTVRKNNRPIVVSTIPDIHLLENQGFVFRLPANIFSDSDGDKLIFKLSYLNTKTQTDHPVMKGYWIDLSNNTLYMFPTSEFVGVNRFILKASDPYGEYANAMFSVQVQRDDPISYNNIFNITLEGDFQLINNSVEEKIKLLETIALAQDVSDYKSLRAVEFLPGSIIVRWSIDTLKNIDCDASSLQKIKARFDNLTFSKYFAPYVVLNFGMTERKTCSNEITRKIFENWKFMLIAVVTGVVVSTMIFLAVYCLCKRKRNQEKENNDGEIHLDLKKTPVVFPEDTLVDANVNKGFSNDTENLGTFINQSKGQEKKALIPTNSPKDKSAPYGSFQLGI